MDDEKRSQLNAWFDGELEPEQKASVDSLIESDPEARAYVESLAQTREALKHAHQSSAQPVPEWSEVEKRLDESSKRPAMAISFPRAILTAAAVMVLGMAIWWPVRQAGIRDSANTGEFLVERVEFVETDLEGATPVVYLDEPSGWTVVWVLESDEEES